MAVPIQKATIRARSKRRALLGRVIRPERLRGESRRSHAQETETPEEEIENDGGGGDRAKKMRLTEPADDRRVGDAEQRRRQMRERHRQREPHDTGVADMRRISASAWVVEGTARRSASARVAHIHEPQHQPDRNDDRGAREDIIGDLADRIEAEAPDAINELVIPRKISAGLMSSHIRKAPTIKDTNSRRRKTLPGEPPRKRFSAVSSRLPGRACVARLRPRPGGALGAERSSSIMRTSRSNCRCVAARSQNAAKLHPCQTSRRLKRDGSGFAAADAERRRTALQPVFLQRREKRHDDSAPDAPIGWPSAQAPPCTLTFSCGRESSCIAAMVTTAKASLISKRSTSARDQPVLSISFRKAPIGAVGNWLGACAWVAWALIVAKGARPRLSASERRMRTSAAAPSEIELEFAAVTVPPSRKTGFKKGILSSLALSGCSSCETILVAVLAGLDRDRRDLFLKSAVVDRLLRPLQRGDGEGVLRGAGELKAFGAVFRESAHRQMRAIGILEPVEEHMIEEFAMPHAVAGSGAVEQIGRVGHALHAARKDDSRASRADAVMRKHDGFHARTAHLIDRRAGRRLGQAGGKRGLAGGSLALARRQDAAKNQLVDLLWPDA